MSAIEERDWQKVDEAKINRNQGHEANERQPADRYGRAGKLRDFQRPAELLSRPMASDNLTDDVGYRLNRMLRFPKGCRDGLQRANAFMNCLGSDHAKQSDFELVSARI